MPDLFFIRPNGHRTYIGEVTELRLQAATHELGHCTACGAVLLPGDESSVNVLTRAPAAPRCQRCTPFPLRAEVGP